jgi:hypothetical protein
MGQVSIYEGVTYQEKAKLINLIKDCCSKGCIHAYERGLEVGTLAARHLVPVPYP